MSEATSIEGILAERVWLEGVARALVGDSAEDAVQETFLSAMRSPPPKGRPIRPWLIRVLRNAARMQARSDARRDLRESLAAEPEGQADASQLLARAKAVDALMRKVAELDPSLREVLLLRHGEGLSAADIGRLLDVPAGTIRWRHKEALEILRRRLDSENGGERNTWQLALIPLGSSAALAKPSSIGVFLAMKASFTIISAAVLAIGGIAAFILHGGTDTTRAEGQSDAARPVNTVQTHPTAREAHAGLSGRVLKSDGQALANATVFVSPTGHEAPELAAHDAVASTDANGGYAFVKLPAGAYVVSASASGYVPAQASITLLPGEPLSNIDLQLEAGGQEVKGHVHDLIGGTVGAAIVEFVPMVGSGFGRSKVATQSDDSGYYELSLASGRYLALASHPDYVAQGKTVVVIKGTQAIDFELSPGAEVEGVVLRASDDAPVPFASISYASESGWGLLDESRNAGRVLADDKGHFRISGLRSGSLSLRARSANAVSSEPTRVALGIADHRSDVLLYVSDALQVKGRVLDADTHEPVSGMVVQASADTIDAGVATRSAGDGSFVIEGLAPGTYQFQASGKSYLPRFFGKPTQVHENRDDLVIEVERGSMLRGRIEPAQAASLRVDLRSIEGFSSNALPRAQSDATGEFEIGPFSPGSFALQAENAEGQQGQSSVTIADADVDGIVITLEDSASLAGSVADAEGTALDDVVVTLRRAADRNRSIVVNGEDMMAKSAHTSPDGSFLVVGLSEGEYEVQVQDAQGDMLLWAGSGTKQSASKPKTMLFAKAQHKEQVRLSVQTRDARIEGVVLGPDGSPAPDVWVTASGSQPLGLLDAVMPEGSAEPTPAGPQGARGKQEVEMRTVAHEEHSTEGGFDAGSAHEHPPVLTNDKGEFVISGLRQGHYDLRAEGLRGTARAFKRAAKTGESVRIALATLTRIDGLVQSGDKPVSDFVIELQGQIQRRKRVRAKDGRFVLHRVDPGHYKIIARNSEGEAEASIDVLAGAATNVSLQMETLTRVQGHIVDSAGTAIEGALVIAAPVQTNGGMDINVGDDTLATSADGRFEIGVRPGKYMLVALDPGSGPLASMPFEVKGDTSILDLGKVTQTPGGGIGDMGGQ